MMLYICVFLPAQNSSMSDWVLPWIEDPLFSFDNIPSSAYQEYKGREYVSQACLIVCTKRLSSHEYI